MNHNYGRTSILIIIERPDVYFLKIKYQDVSHTQDYISFIMRMGIVLLSSTVNFKNSMSRY